MININLRPWRKNQRDRIKKEYTHKLTLLGVLCVVSMLGLYQFYNNQINTQKNRNSYLTSVDKELTTKIKEIDALKSERNSILNRMEVINALQSDRKNTVRILDEMNEDTPKSVYLTYMNRTGEQFKLEGIADTNSDISLFLEKLQNSKYFSNAKLGKINLIRDESTIDKNKFFITSTEKNNDINKEQGNNNERK
jgi:type IV pilus assembly protein PilN